MKTNIFSLRKLFLLAAIPLFSALFLVACSKDNINDDGSGDSQVYPTQANASGDQLNPAVSTTGSSKLVGTYDPATNKWEYSIDWNSLLGTASLIEFHGPAGVGVNGDILFSLSIAAGGSNGARSETTTLTEQQESYLLNGQIYYTILTSAHVTGEVRGQVYIPFR